MKIEDSVRIKNRISFLSLFIAVVVYVVATVATFGIALLVLVPCALVAFYLSGVEIERAKSTSNVFKKSYPLSPFGVQYGDFEHVFHYASNLESEIIESVIRELRKRTSVQSIDPMTITDIDKKLKSSEGRQFMRADAGQTQRGTTITLIMQTTRFGSMQSVHWWVLGGGYIDRNKRFNFIAYAGLSLWVWIVPYLKREYDLLALLRTVYPGTYNSLDITTRVRCLHEAVFSAMIGVLENHDIDVSDIKMQRSSVMNISVSGGKMNVGNLVQGAKNRIVGGVANSGGAKA